MAMHGHGQLQSPLRRRWRAKRLRVVGKDSDSGPADSARAPAPCPREWQPPALRISIRVRGGGAIHGAVARGEACARIRPRCEGLSACARPFLTRRGRGERSLRPMSPAASAPPSCRRLESLSLHRHEPRLVLLVNPFGCRWLVSSWRFTVSTCTLAHGAARRGCACPSSRDSRFPRTGDHASLLDGCTWCVSGRDGRRRRGRKSRTEKRTGPAA